MVSKLKPQTAITLIDRHWMVDVAYADAAKDIIEGMDWSTHVADAKALSSDNEDRSPAYNVVNGVAEIAMFGPMTKRATSMSSYFGGCATEDVCKAIADANNDQSVASIKLIMDSPGGQVSGTETLGNTVKNSAKPVDCLVSGQCCSAAYWVACCCRSIDASAVTDMIGSIGVVMSLWDTSKRMEDAGVKVHVISSGPHKGAGADGAPITKAHREEFQRMIDGLAGTFKSTVAAGRGFSEDAINALATGQVWDARDALRLGLIDSINGVKLTKGAEVPTGEQKMSFKERLTAFLHSTPDDDSEILPASASVFAGGVLKEVVDPEIEKLKAELKGQSDTLATQVAEVQKMLAEAKDAKWEACYKSLQVAGKILPAQAESAKTLFEANAEAFEAFAGELPKRSVFTRPVTSASAERGTQLAMDTDEGAMTARATELVKGGMSAQDAFKQAAREFPGAASNIVPDFRMEGVE